MQKTSNLVQKERKRQSLFFSKMKDNVFMSSMFISIALAIVFIAALVIFIESFTWLNFSLFISANFHGSKTPSVVASSLAFADSIDSFAIVIAGVSIPPADG